MLARVFAEKLQAIASPWANWISSLCARFIDAPDGIPSVIDISLERGRSFQSLAQLVYCCHSYPETVTPSAGKIEQFLNGEDEPSNKFKREMVDVMTAFWHIANTEHLRYGFKKVKARVAPVEFVFIGTFFCPLRL